MFPTTIFLGEFLVVAVAMFAVFILPASARVQIILFQGLSCVLVMLTLWTTLISGDGWSILLTMIPIGFAVFINPLANRILGPGTIAPLSIWQRISYSVLGLGLIALIFAVAPYLPTIGGGSVSLRLPPALALVLVGLCSWLVRKDLISQAIGLLVMDDGLLLLSESVIHRTELTFVLLVILFLYLLVPLTCLLLVMPRLRQTTLKLDVDQFRKLRG
jgi:hydrogenase-4 membrane subunit HyfE